MLQSKPSSYLPGPKSQVKYPGGPKSSTGPSKPAEKLSVITNHPYFKKISSNIKKPGQKPEL